MNNFVLEKLNINYIYIYNKLCKFLSNKIDQFNSLNVSYLIYFLRIPKYSIFFLNKNFYILY